MIRPPEARRIATLVAFVHCLEASAQDDALDVLDLLLRELFSRAEKEDMAPVAGFASQKPSFVRGHILGERLKNPSDRL